MWFFRLARREDDTGTGGQFKTRYIVLSAFLHVGIVALILVPWLTTPEDAPPPLVVPYVEANGAPGAAGGPQGGGAGQEKRTADPSAPAAADNASTKPEEQSHSRPVDAPNPPRIEKKSTAPAPTRVARAAPQPPLPRPPHARPARSHARPQSTAIAQAPAPLSEPTPNTVTLPEPRTQRVASASPAAIGGARPSRATEGPGTGDAPGLGSIGRQPGGLYGTGQGPGDDYFERLRRWLEKYRQYPKRAVQRQEQGTVYVEFVIARDGTVEDAHITRSSGYFLLDQAVFDMLQRASPVPPLPAAFPGDRGRIEMPIDFSISWFDRVFGG